ncbi:semaphorin-5B-like isoform X1 [Neoarius graeffei]|uniref:semaphorin-5B-like isoform X1 n=1 Tax=Neoarius graeffei TaxID=443677 RepID=UPI00298C0B40|nr:semaphorin-5B-like isoform X1 [Neoarius graeffei]XP_060774364.1 semaphorin-5B-like isoform X1 [Neoarius graeffei]XP_060774365.1 semaphorin-5B-like isoform X1 [Neoarius graeffei]
MVTMSATSIYSPGPIIILLSLSLYPLLTSQHSLTSDPDLITSHAQKCSMKLHPVTAYEALSVWLSSFSMPGVSDYSQLVLDLSRNQLIIGARNYLFRLSLANVSLLQGMECGVDEDTRRSCRSKGKTEDECQNYMRVLLLTGSRLFSCGTNAFSPICTTRFASDLAHVIETVNGVARCPYDPKHNSTAMVTESGDLYAATVIDFSGRDPVIYRSLGNMPPLRTAQYNSKWLNEPQFVSAYEVGRFTYFFLREVAVEEDCGKAIFSRVARVCQNDVGGRFLLEDTWTTFMKARLNCSRSGDVPFYYHELHSTFYLPEQDLIYGIFTTNVNSIAASAVCAFNLSAITQAFNGPFRYQENPRTSWLSTPNPIPNFQCGTVGDNGPGGNLTERSLQDAQRLFLMNEVVQPVSVDPLISQDNIRFSKLVVDIVQGRDTLYHVIYIGTEHGTIIKALSTSSQNLRGCYLEEMKLLPSNQQEPILNLQILQSDRSLFVGLSSRVLKIPLERCSSYETQQECLYARDPYCGWDRKKRRCTTIESSSNMSQWSQNITQCPEQNLTRDGGFSPWSSWQACTHDDGGESSSTCLCRFRVCDDPVPQCGGAECVGPTMEVTNCSRSGSWTPWSSWAQCSTTCGVGFEVRQRSCSNPTPRHGGKVCVGQTREERLCNEDSVCPLPVSWAQWTSWSTCTVVCGGGFQSRVRTCENGISCPGCPQEYRTCNLEACPEVRRYTPWSPWYPVNVTVGGVRQEQRVRHTCRAPLADTHLLQLGKRKAEMRHCPPAGGASGCETDGLVQDLMSVAQPLTPVQGVTWLPWETWSSCSKECSRGFRTRKRLCVTSDGKSSVFLCSGMPVEYQDCNTQPCPVKGAWTCWSSWSECSTSCGGGHYQRTRTCSNPAPSHSGDICIGLHTEEALCNMHECDGGWGVWSEWTKCEDVFQYRTRVCEISPAPCKGNHTDQRLCPPKEIAIGSSGGKKGLNCGAFSLFHLILTGAVSFLVALLGSILVYVFFQKVYKPIQEPAVIHPNTPNHLHHKHNTSTPKNEKYTPMEFKTLNKNSLLPDESCNFYPPPPPQTNVYTTTYYAPPLGKYDFPSLDSPCRNYMHS